LNGDQEQLIENKSFKGKDNYRKERLAHWNRVADTLHSSIFSSHYHRRLGKVYSFLIPIGSKILEVGCGTGDLLAYLQPSYGVGVDLSQKMLDRARAMYPDLRFICEDAHEMSNNLRGEKFDYIILSDLLNDLWDIQIVLQQVSLYCNTSTRIIMNFYSHLWQLPLSIAQKAGLAKPLLIQNWITRDDMLSFLNLSGFEAIKFWREVLFPVPIPVIEQIFNRFLVKIWPFQAFAIANFIIARHIALKQAEEKNYSISVIVAARNEEGNIESIFQRILQMGAKTELIFVEGNSKDNTYYAIEQAMMRHPEISCRLFRQDGIGKGDAVRKGFLNARGDILMILDADLTVAPEDLQRFYHAIVMNRGEFINGVRLVYPIEKDAMRFFNLAGNKFFSLAFSWLLGQPIKDTLCGTKVLWKKDYDLLAANRSYFGDFDPFGDFDLLFGAARLGLKIVDLPIRYGKRMYGATNIQRWNHGWLLLKMAWFAAIRLKFV
jgi:SAM-dependent methyltransferase